MTYYDADELIAMARAAERDDRLSTGALYGKLANALEQEIRNWKRRDNDACALRAALVQIADIAEGSETANSLPHLAKIARAAISTDCRIA